ncbi:ankyrin repeat-containing protein BDA1-like isoform X2 [Mangifera indica]|uniref:ankyrin repeat-containing protein BDA1-like isoform X2 n=1 Tax=Mangifera indica TaxID=29780 RepID=UPI001CFBA36A|nr:ankyrin repeat-containing protein BDA1-like isoform X2 [Mangifera indica]
MDERLQNAAMEGNVDALYSVLAEDPYVLERIDQVPFVATPLHTAAREGKIHFAKEILNLKPSFARKRDHLGRSPLHLALEGKHLQEGLSPRDLDLEEKYQELVTWLIKHDSEIVRVKAKGMVTALHYAAQLDDESSVADFLYVCPLSIEELTVKSETVVHIAVKNGSLKAFKVLLGWLRRFNKEEILKWKDEEGNNPLHTAVSADQPEMVKLLIGYLKVNIKNSKGLTALDIFYVRRCQGSVDAAVGDILLAANAKTACQLHRPSLRDSKKPLLVEYFSGGSPFSEKILKRFSLGYRRVEEVPLEVRNVLLVVAILIATATYQAALSPPGGYWQDDGNLQPAANNTGISNTTSTIFNTEQHAAGEMILQSSGQLLFLTFNSLAFFTSVCFICTLVAGLPFYGIILAMTSWMEFSYFSSILETIEYGESFSLGPLFIIFLFVSVLATYCIPSFLDGQHSELTRHGRRKNLRMGSFEQPKI